MDKKYFDRYQFFEEDGSFRIIPGIEMPIKYSDRYAQYKKGKDRLDKWSDQYYGSPTFGWVIMQANPLAGSLEFEIPDNFLMRIPYPLIPSLQDYKKAVETYKQYYGE
jgi:hypothetical protein